MFGQKSEISIRTGGKKIIQIIVLKNLHLGPVIQPGPFELFVIDPETQGTDQMEGCPDSRACPGDIPGVLGNPGLVKNNMEGCHKEILYRKIQVEAIFIPPLHFIDSRRIKTYNMFQYFRKIEKKHADPNRRAYSAGRLEAQ
jgi:hypothetical protein